MWSTLIGIGIGLLLAIHGFAHWQLTTLWGSRPEASSWLLGASGAGLGNALWVLALLTFLAAGIGAGFHWSWWRPAAILASVISLAVMALYWDSNMALGAAVNIGVLVGLLWLRWPTPEMVGA
jgi:hypothetical protein